MPQVSPADPGSFVMTEFFERMGPASVSFVWVQALELLAVLQQGFSRYLKFGLALDSEPVSAVLVALATFALATFALVLALVA
jgi:hypothetical protein